VVGLEALDRLGRRAARNARAIAGVFVCACAAALSGCAALWPQTAELRKALPAGVPEKVELAQVPFFPQEEYQCGPAALATALATFGAKVTPEELVPQVYIPERKGSLQIEMLAAARRHGMVSYQLAPRFEHLLRELAAGHPVIVLQNLGIGEGWHYAVAVGYDYERGELLLRSGTTERQVLAFTVHEVVWKRSGYWAMVALPPQRIPATADEQRWLGAIAALERAGDAANARVAYTAFRSRWPQNVAAAVGLANVHYALGALPEAERVLREALEREPDSVIALNNLAQTLSDLGRNEEALRFIERAMDGTSAPGSPFSAAVQETRQTIRSRMQKGSRIEN
jgi:tetratricopeptide (TPR) repeat protein